MSKSILVLWVIGMMAVALGREPAFEEYRAVQESLSRVHPRVRASWLREHGLDDSYYTTFRRPESTGLGCIGRWPWGPSWELAGRDTFLYLGSGSGVRILSISDSVHPRMLGQINARGLVSQVVVQDSLLFVACGSWGAQVYSVADPANPRELGSMDAVISDVCVKDTFCYAVGGDSLRIYNVASPSLPSLAGAIRDSGDLVVVANGYAFSAGRWVMNIYNVVDPAHPAWATSRGGPAYAMFVRRNLLFCSSVQPDNMTVLNISDPLNITQVSQVDGYGGEGLYVDDTCAYLSCTYGHHGLFVVDVSDSSRPVMHDSIDPEGAEEWEPYVPRLPGYGYLADDYGGLVVLDLHDINSISEVWAGYKAHEAVDIFVDGQRAYVADLCSGLQIIDVADPTRPASLGIFDTVGSKITSTATARDSFAFSSMSGMSGRRDLLSLNVLNPANPALVAQESCFNPPQDVVLKDTLIYAAEPYEFEIFNVARPREPVLVGSCDISGTGVDLLLQDTLAYVSSLPTQIINVGNPTSPLIIGTIPTYGHGIAIRDSFAFVPALYDSMVIYNVVDPTAPVRVARHTFSGGHVWNSGIALVDRLLYVSGDVVHVVDVADPLNSVEVGTWIPPHETRRLCYAAPYVYAASYDAGVCILETMPTGIAESKRGDGNLRSASVYPSVSTGRFAVDFGRWPPVDFSVYNAAGVRVLRTLGRGGDRTRHRFEFDLSGYPDGVYFVEPVESKTSLAVKMVKTKGR